MGEIQRVRHNKSQGCGVPFNSCSRCALASCSSSSSILYIAFCSRAGSSFSCADSRSMAAMRLLVSYSSFCCSSSRTRLCNCERRHSTNTNEESALQCAMAGGGGERYATQDRAYLAQQLKPSNAFCFTLSSLDLWALVVLVPPHRGSRC